MEVTDHILREALNAYVHTFPSRDALRAHIARGRLEEIGGQIEASLDACLGAAEKYLYDYPGGVPWTDEFKLEFEKMLRSACPWLDRRALDTLMSFSGWLCWHEGLNRNA